MPVSAIISCFGASLGLFRGKAQVGLTLSGWMKTSASSTWRGGEGGMAGTQLQMGED